MKDFACKPTRHCGFTLIEMMVVVAVIAILASVAFPSYKKMVLKSHRTEAHALLQAAQLGQEKFRINSTTYSSSLSGNAFSRVGTSEYYDLSVSNASESGYLLTATAKGTQTDDTGCTTITLEQTASDITYGPSSACWSK